MCSYGNISEADVTRLREDIHIETCKACNVELSSKTKKRITLHLLKKNNIILCTHKFRIFSHIFDAMNRLNTHMTIVQDTAPSALPKIDQIVGILEKTGGRRQAAGGRLQEAGGRRQEAGGRRQEAGGRRQEAGGRRQDWTSNNSQS